MLRQSESYKKHVSKRKLCPVKSYTKSKMARKEISDGKKRIQKFKLHISQGPYFICVVCNRCLYKQLVKLFHENKYDTTLHENIFDFRILSFDEKEYICITCDSKLIKNKIPCQAVINDLELHELPADFSDIRRLEKVLIAKRILFKKVTIMPKGQAPKIKGTICNVPIEADQICNILPRGMDNNGIITVSLKKRMKFKSNVYLEPVRPDLINEILQYLKQVNPLYENIEIDTERIPPNFLNSVGSDESNDDNDMEIDFETSANNKDNEEENNPLDSYRVAASETAYVPELPFSFADEQNVTIAPGEDRQPLAIICDEKCEMLAHPHLFPKGKFGYTYDRDIKLSPCKYFNQRLLNYTQIFSSDPDYIFFLKQ